MNSPLVSICCLTYNHRPFIEKCLESFLMQKTTFPVEILIHDDCSTDGTDDVIREYAKKYPELIYPLFEEENQYSKPGRESMDFFNYRRAHGKYIAYCEGDDYWIDPLKLQKQVDFMEANQEYSVTFHRCKHYCVEDGMWSEDNCGELFVSHKKGAKIEGVDIDIPTFLLGNWCTQPLSMLFRKSVFSFEWQKKYKYYRDMHEIYNLLKVGKGYLFGWCGGVYVRHKEGISSMIDKEKQYVISYQIAEELYRKSPDKYTKENLLKTYQWLIDNYVKIDNSVVALIFKQFCLSSNAKRLIKNMIKYLQGKSI